VKKLLLVVLAIMVLSMLGCSSAPAITPPSGTVPVSGSSSPTSHIVYEGTQNIPKYNEGFGIYGRTTFDTVYPGWSGTVPLTIVNGQDRDRLFVISLVSPTKTTEGYEPFPQEYFYWVTISQPTVTVLRGGTYQVPITLAVPADAERTGAKWELRILVEDTTQTGLVQIALEAKWFVITAD